jgi:glyoxylase I family protein
MAIHHLALTSPRVEELADFYRVVLGLPELTRHTDEQGLRSVWLDLDPGVLMVERASTQPAPAETGWFLLALTIEPGEREAWRQRLGAHFTHESGFTLYGVDLDGNRFGLSHYPTPAP